MVPDTSLFPAQLSIAVALFALVSWAIQTGSSTLGIFKRRNPVDSLIADIQHAVEISEQLDKTGYSNTKSIIDEYISELLTPQLRQVTDRAILDLHRSKLSIVLVLLYRFVVNVPVLLALNIIWLVWISSDWEYGFQGISGQNFGTWLTMLIAIVGMSIITSGVVFLGKFVEWRYHKWFDSRDSAKAAEVIASQISR